MELLLKRLNNTETATTGELSIDGQMDCYTQEGATLIPTGTYVVKMGYSQRFGSEVPMVQDVPNFTDVCIGFDNHSSDLAGSVIVGYILRDNAVRASRPAFMKLTSRLRATETINLTVE